MKIKQGFEEITDGYNFKTEPFLMALLSSKINSIARNMATILERSSRSSVMSVARDCSTAICGPDGDVIALPNGFIVHVANMSLVTRSLFKIHDVKTFRPGDAYLNNSPYHGNTHMADFTIIVPVFYEDEILFYCTVRGHQADIGNCQPTTYSVFAKDIYEEGGICFPCVKIQENYKDVNDIIRLAKMKIRVSDIWYGDYLAQIGAARIGERMLIDVVKKYGKEVVKTFCEERQKYGRMSTEKEIRKFPAGTWYNETKYDSIPGILDEGVTVRVKLTINPEKGRIICDFRDNADSVPCGINCCEATILSAGRGGVFNHMSENIPLCEGSFSCVKVLMREGSVVGKAKYPFSSSLATTNVANRALIAVQGAFNKIGKYELAMADGAFELPPSMGVISGFDPRYSRNYVTEVISGTSGGGAVYGYDGLLPHCISNGGMLKWNPLEIIEQKYPVIYYKQEIITDSGGAGEWNGNPSTEVILASSTSEPVNLTYACDGHENPPRGAFGGHDGIPAQVALHSLKEAKIIKYLPTTHYCKIKTGQAIVSNICSGAGVGDPLDRDPEKVRHDVRGDFVSLEKARKIYGVVINTETELYSVDYEATEELRNNLKEKRG